MPDSQLTAYLLDKSLIDYTITVTSEALRSNDALQAQTKKRAAHALKFFLDILDPSIDEENQQLETFKTYHAALSGTSFASV